MSPANMAQLTSPLFSPQSFASTPSNMPLSNASSRSSSVPPLQPLVSSASVVPQSVRNNSSTPHISSNQYIEQHRMFMEHQRQLHEEERALWDVERKELKSRIHELEDMVKKLGGRPMDTFEAAGSHVGSSGLYPASNMGRSHSTGDEFWRGAGGKSDANPTRSFSDSTERPLPLTTSTPRPLSSIQEDPPSRKKSVGFAGMEPLQSPPETQDFFTHPIPGHNSIPRGISTIPGDRISASLDGITLKSSGLPSEVVIRAIASNSGTPSPMGTPASHFIPSSHTSSTTSAPVSAAPRPSIIHLPSSGLTAEDLRSKDAGHTPLARLTEDESANISSQDTPIVKVAEPEKPIDPAPSRLRQPLERSDSYFPDEPAQREHDDALAATDEDPSLSGPLTLHGDPKSKENDQFLSQLDSKLLQASTQRSNSLDTASDASLDTDLRRIRSAEGDRPTSKGEDRPGLMGDEPEPRLRMKRSTNFGSAFGAKSLGSGF